MTTVEPLFQNHLNNTAEATVTVMEGGPGVIFGECLSSVQFQMVPNSKCLCKPLCAQPHLSDISQCFLLKTTDCNYEKLELKWLLLINANNITK